MEMLSHAYFTKADDGHDTDIQGEHRTTLLVTRDHGNAEAFGGYGVRFETFGFCLPLDIWCPTIAGSGGCRRVLHLLLQWWLLLGLE
jgi:hypothetical protein